MEDNFSRAVRGATRLGGITTNTYGFFVGASVDPITGHTHAHFRFRAMEDMCGDDESYLTAARMLDNIAELHGLTSDSSMRESGPQRRRRRRLLRDIIEDAAAMLLDEGGR